MSAPTGHDGLRARKKQRTRSALVEAGLDLFLRHGYDATTVDEIAAAVEVSPRTFFRYFAGKEDIALAKGAELDEQIVTAFLDAPAGEPPLPALRRAVLSMVRDSASTEGVPNFLRLQHLINRTPSLLAGSLRRSSETQHRIAEEIGRRHGVDAARDLRPHVLVGVVFTGLHLGLEAMCADPRRDLDRLVELVGRAVDLASAGVPDRWGDEPDSW
ncbi:TetR family transcriptional regulator [Saccharopolyspora cebuensis]|uniref:TetR family transcriptional regulator n=1 Tax=Saccharopolyspora cebuensis TaxID=418759 RepID=UPI0031ED79C6